MWVWPVTGPGERGWGSRPRDRTSRGQTQMHCRGSRARVSRLKPQPLAWGGNGATWGGETRVSWALIAHPALLIHSHVLTCRPTCPCTCPSPHLSLPHLCAPLRSPVGPQAGMGGASPLLSGAGPLTPSAESSGGSGTPWQSEAYCSWEAGTQS